MEINYEAIARANETIKTTPISGKEYAEVNQRIKAFRMVYPLGFIVTTMTSNEEGVCVFNAKCGFYDEKGDARIIGTGTAYEKENSTFINKTSYIENCETSAVGRALGMAGFGIDASVASYEEVKTAQANQNNEPNKKTAQAKKPAEDPMNVLLEDRLDVNAPAEIREKFEYFTQILNGNVKKVLVALNKTNVNDITLDEWDKVIEMQKAGIDRKRAKEGK